METYDRALIVDPNNVLALLHSRPTVSRSSGNMPRRRPASKNCWHDLRPCRSAHALGQFADPARTPSGGDRVLARAIALGADNADAHFQLALALLTLGDFDAGWSEYEWRFRTEGLKASRFDLPSAAIGTAWSPRRQDHSSLHRAGARRFHHVRALRSNWWPALGATVHRPACCRRPRCWPTRSSGVTPIAPGDPLPSVRHFRLRCSACLILLKTRIDTIPANVPYIRPRATGLRLGADRLPRGKKPTVGVVWGGGKEFKGDHNRSIALQRFEALFDASGVSFVSLHARPARGEMPNGCAMAGRPACRGGSSTDFADTAAIISMLDLVISVDTSVAHLAGAMAKPVWILLPLVPDFRWQLDRSDSPWYPTARLFRQPKAGDWDGVLANVKSALSELGLRGLPTAVRSRGRLRRRRGEYFLTTYFYRRVTTPCNTFAGCRSQRPRRQYEQEVVSASDQKGYIHVRHHP